MASAERSCLILCPQPEFSESVLTGGSLEKTLDMFSHTSGMTGEANFPMSLQTFGLSLRSMGSGFRTVTSTAVVTLCHSFPGNREEGVVGDSSFYFSLLI